MKTRRRTRAFAYGAGIRFAGSNIACDSFGLASDLVFLSHANALPPRARAPELGRHRFVSTERTLHLLADAGTNLRDHALPASFGQPFNLGPRRIELLPSGHLPGAAALLCELEKEHALYLGAFCPEPLLDGVEPFSVRRAEALCIDACSASPGLVFPPRQQAIAEIRAFVEKSRAAGDRVALLGSAFGALPAVVVEISRAGIAMRAHRRVAAVLARLHGVCESVPELPRFSGKLDKGEVLLWPSEARNAASLVALGDLHLGLVSGLAADAATLASARVTRGFPLTNRPSFAEILATVESSGAREVALFGGYAESAATALRERGLDAYTLGPPRQMPLPTQG